MTLLSVEVMAYSRKENGHCLPIHPKHLHTIDEDLRSQVFLEQGYGVPFGCPTTCSPASSAGCGRAPS